MNTLEKKLAIAEKGIQDFLDGEYEHPRTSRPNECTHNAPYYTECGLCDTEHFVAVQKAIRDVET